MRQTLDTPPPSTEHTEEVTRETNMREQQRMKDRFDGIMVEKDGKLQRLDGGQIDTTETGAEAVAKPQEVIAEAGEDPEKTFINPEKDLEDITAQMQKNSERIDAIKQSTAEDMKKLNDTRVALGLPPLESPLENAANNNELRALEEDQIKLKEKEENAKYEKDLEGMLKLLGALPKTELKIIIETGKTPDGKLLKTPGGKEVNSDVAKKLAEAAESGATKITKAVLSAVLGIVKGILKGIFAVAKAAVTE